MKMTRKGLRDWAQAAYLTNPSAREVSPPVAPDRVVVTAARAAIWAEMRLSIISELPGLKPYLRGVVVGGDH